MNAVVADIANHGQPSAELMLHIEAPALVIAVLGVLRLKGYVLAQIGFKAKGIAGRLGEAVRKRIRQRAGKSESAVGTAVLARIGTEALLRDEKRGGGTRVSAGHIERGQRII